MVDFEIQDFQNDIVEASYTVPVVVDFWAPWCGPCKIIGPVLEKLAQSANGAWKLVKINTDENQELAAQFGIRSIPMVMIFENGEKKDEFIGALPQPQIEAWLKKNVSTKQASAVDTALELLANGDYKSAVAMLSELSQNPEDKRARIHYASIVLFEDLQLAARLLEGIEPDKAEFELFTALNTLISVLSPVKPLPDGAIKEKYSGAIEKLKLGEFESTLADLIECIREDRYYHDDSARSVCIAIFKYLGEEHPITVKYRRPFGSALYI
ncbi:MAG: thioredoxin [Ignavibacteria bacterium]|nr:thioredoxin [Ignavibacteria bacterium]